MPLRHSAHAAGRSRSAGTPTSRNARVDDKRTGRSRADLAARQQRAEVVDAWRTWAREATPATRDSRRTAFEAVARCLKEEANTLVLAGLDLDSIPDVLPPRVTHLNLSNNRLTRLPERWHDGLKVLLVQQNRLTELPGTLPKGLEALNVDHNELVALPESLPEDLLSLEACDNRLVRLPEHLPPSVETINVDGNLLSALPEQLPDGLRTFYASENQLDTLPAHLPQQLQLLNLEGNRLTELPPCIFTLPTTCVVGLERNNLGDTAVSLLHAHTLQRVPTGRQNRDPGHESYPEVGSGPIIYFSMFPLDPGTVEVPLHVAVSRWLPETIREQAPTLCESFSNEDGAAAFSSFLVRLGETVGARSNPRFGARVAAWLTTVLNTTSLRSETFQLAQGATETCEDRVALTFNQMQIAALRHSVETGQYDNRLPELLDAGREMFCLDSLERIARDKTKTLRVRDELEVYLAFQTKLREPLKLNIVGEEMRFYEASGVTSRDLSDAQAQIESEQRSQLFTWLAQWPPFKSWIGRLDPVRSEASADIALDTFEAEHAHRVQAHLHAEGLADVPDAEAAIGRRVMEAMMRERDTALAEGFILDRFATAIDRKDPQLALWRIEELVHMASRTPSVAAHVIRLRDHAGHHLGSKIAEIVETAGAAPLADAYLCLLQRMHGDGHLVDRDLIDALLPRHPGDPVKALSHAIAHAAWASRAATRLCAILSDVADHDAGVRNNIVERTSVRQTVHDVENRALQVPMDFFKLAKQSDRADPNPHAVGLLKQRDLIPSGRELRKRPVDKHPARIEAVRDYRTLLDTIGQQVPPALAQHPDHRRLVEQASTQALQQTNAGRPAEQQASDGAAAQPASIRSRLPWLQARWAARERPVALDERRNLLAALWPRPMYSWNLPAQPGGAASVSLPDGAATSSAVVGLAYRPLDGMYALDERQRSGEHAAGHETAAGDASDSERSIDALRALETRRALALRQARQFDADDASIDRPSSQA